ncbi:SRPBCC family protein [Paenibacillus mesophilus]|uniref:SRPBCC family protein n=1 Tax=Paenibacillus mesophilus TaxID=2582849 RepID=UPI00110DD768|nr:SRPBCC family protein [Paenibacillus mesophilus]TMV42656.1 SRPBCC family protein [Paenibacillus mesophilus]
MTPTAKSRTLGISIQRPQEQVYDYILDLARFPDWATSFCLSIREEDGKWLMQTLDGPAEIRFVERNKFGVLDHVVTPSSGPEASVSMRAIANGTGCEVLLTIFQQPAISDEKFRNDADMVMRDLLTLKSVLERSGT